MRSLASLWLVLFMGLVGACGATGDGTDAGTDLAIQEDVPAVDLVDLAETPADTFTDTAADTAAEVIEPVVPLYLVASTLPLGSNALFFNAKADPGRRCALRREGNCSISDCRVTTDEPGLVAGLDAGKITLDNGDGTPIELTPAVTGAYTPWIAAIKWKPGEDLSFQAAGGVDLPAFQAEVQGFPPPPEVLSPTGAATLDRTQDFTATWTPVDGRVLILLQQQPLAPVWFDDLRIICEFADGQAGTGTIPASVVSLMQANSPSIRSGIAVARYVVAEVSAGGRAIQAVGFNGVPFNATVK